MLDNDGCPKPSTIGNRIEGLRQVDGQEEHEEIIADAQLAKEAAREFRQGWPNADEAEEILSELGEYYSEIAEELRTEYTEILKRLTERDLR